MKLPRLRRQRRNRLAEFTGNNAPLLLAGVAAGAALVYLTSSRGKRHRQMAMDKTVSAARSAGSAIGSRARDLRNRAQGMVARTRGRPDEGWSRRDETLDGPADMPRSRSSRGARSGRQSGSAPTASAEA